MRTWRILVERVQTEIDIVRDVSSRLDRAGIDYMLTGSMAMNYYAQPRMTRGIDMVVELSKADAPRVVQLFSGNYYVSAEAVEGSIAHESIFNLIHQESIIKVDCIIRKKAFIDRLNSNGEFGYALRILRRGL